MEYISEVEPIKVKGFVVASYGSKLVGDGGGRACRMGPDAACQVLYTRMLGMQRRNCLLSGALDARSYMGNAASLCPFN